MLPVIINDSLVFVSFVFLAAFFCSLLTFFPYLSLRFLPGVSFFDLRCFHRRSLTSLVISITSIVTVCPNSNGGSASHLNLNVTRFPYSYCDSVIIKGSLLNVRSELPLCTECFSLDCEWFRTLRRIFSTPITLRHNVAYQSSQTVFLGPMTNNCCT